MKEIQNQMADLLVEKHGDNIEMITFGGGKLIVEIKDND